MKRSNRLVLLIGIFLALIAFVLILVTLGNGSGGPGGPTETTPTTTTIVVASRDIKLGDTIKDQDVEQSDVNITDFPANGIKLDSLVIGQIARANVVKGQAVTTEVLEGPSGTIGNVTVPSGFVAIAIQVDQVTGVGTVIKAGDYVDMVTGVTGTDKVPLVVSPTARPGGATPRPNATPPPRAGFIPEVLPYNSTTVKTLIQGVQVLGTLLPPAEQGADNQTPAPGSEANTTTLNGQQQIVILAVTPQDAEVIKFAQMDGSISLVLRATADCQPSESASPSLAPSTVAERRARARARAPARSSMATARSASPPVSRSVASSTTAACSHRRWSRSSSRPRTRRSRWLRQSSRNPASTAGPRPAPATRWAGHHRPIDVRSTLRTATCIRDPWQTRSVS